MQTRKEPILDHYIQASVEQANNRHDYNGRYATLMVNAGDDDLTEIRNALYRSAHHLGYQLDVEVNGRTIMFTAIHRSYKDDYWAGMEVWKRQRNQ